MIKLISFTLSQRLFILLLSLVIKLEKWIYTDCVLAEIEEIEDNNMNQKINPWVQQFQETVDLGQKQVGLPLWKTYFSGSIQRPEKFRQIFQSGPNSECLKSVIEAVDQAQETIMLISFLFAEKTLESALLRAAARGVRVYLLIATEKRLDTESEDDGDFTKKVLAHHKSMLNQMAGKVQIRSASHFHAKLALVDAESPHSQGFLFTSNLTTEALKRNEEITVQLTPSEIDTAFQYLRWAWWEAAEYELFEKGRLSAIKPLNSL